MEYRMLFIWAEGPDDDRFFDKILKPIFEKRYDAVKIINYAVMDKQRIKQLLRSIKEMNADYIFLADIDLVPCIILKKQKIKNRHRSLDEARIVIVIKEIESWYLAGLDDKDCKPLKLGTFAATDTITKQQFDQLKPKKFDSRIDFMLEILKCFSIPTAKRKNKSFKYFAEKYQV